MNPFELRERVLAEMESYVASYEPPLPHAGFGGNPWSRDRVRAEVEKMRPFLIEPQERAYLCEDDGTISQGGALRRKAWAVALHGDYQLLFDPEADDFVLVHDTLDRGLVSWGIRGNAAESFISR